MKSKTLKQLAAMPLHAICGMLPEIEGPEWDELVADVKRHGVRQPVMVWNRSLVDGRHRLKAANEAGRPDSERISVIEVDGDEEAMRRAVIGANLLRRHLEKGQRAMLAQELAGKARPGRRGNADHDPGFRAVADQAGVDERTVRTARKIAEQADPSVTDAVRSGKASVSDADKVKDLLPETQRKAVDEVKAGTSKKLAGTKAVQEALALADRPAEGDAAPEKAARECKPKPAIPVTAATVGAIRSTLAAIEIEMAGDRRSQKVTMSERVFPAADVPGKGREWNGRTWLRPSKEGAERDDALVGEALEAVRAGVCPVLLITCGVEALGREAVARAVAECTALVLPREGGEAMAAILLGDESEPQRARLAWKGAGCVFVPAGSEEDE